jgi:D-alanine-D-alanine ligase
MNNIDKLRVGVLFGGRSGEHEVSLVSARSVLEALNPERYEIIQIGISKDGRWFIGDGVLEALQNEAYEKLQRATLLPTPGRTTLYRMISGEKGQRLQGMNDLDVVFPVLHGTFGEDGTLQGLLELADVAYVGAGVLGSSVGMDKALFKDVMRAHGIPVVESTLILRREIEESLDEVLERAEAVASYPLFVKPANMGSSVGVHKCQNQQDLRKGLQDAARYDRRILVERGVNAREIELSVLGNDQPRASLPGEIRPAAEFYSYEAKYHDESSELLIPAPLSKAQTEEFQEIAVRAYQAMDCAGMARVDFLLDKDEGKLYLNEVNTIPGFTPISMYPKLWDASGLSYPALIDELIQLALERQAEKEKTVWTFKRST